MQWSQLVHGEHKLINDASLFSSTTIYLQHIFFALSTNPETQVLVVHRDLLLSNILYNLHFGVLD